MIREQGLVVVEPDEILEAVAPEEAAPDRVDGRVDDPDDQEDCSRPEKERDDAVASPRPSVSGVQGSPFRRGSPTTLEPLLIYLLSRFVRLRGGRLQLRGDPVHVARLLEKVLEQLELSLPDRAAE